MVVHGSSRETARKKRNAASRNRSDPGKTGHARPSQGRAPRGDPHVRKQAGPKRARRRAQPAEKVARGRVLLAINAIDPASLGVRRGQP